MKELKTLLVPVDFSDNSVKVLQESFYVAKKFGARITVIFVVQTLEDYSGFFVPHMPIAQFHDEMLVNSEKKMKEFLYENFGDDHSCSWKVAGGDVGEEIIGYAKKMKIGMIIMGTHGYKGLERILFGSVAEQVIKSAPCPVLVLNPYQM